MLADKYLLAFVLTYFKRANLTHGAWSPCYFFVALYLAHDMEEDDFDLKNDLIRFGMESLGYSRVGQIETKIFMQRRSKLWHQLDMRTAVNHVCCEEIMKYVLPNNRIWKRERNSDHGGIAIPWRMKSQVHKELGLASSYYECNINCIICVSRKFFKHKIQTAISMVFVPFNENNSKPLINSNNYNQFSLMYNNCCRNLGNSHNKIYLKNGQNQNSYHY